MSTTDQSTLDIIDREIDKLKNAKELDLIATRRLEVLTRIRQIILNRIPEQPKEDLFEDVTDAEILKALKPKKAKKNGK